MYPVEVDIEFVTGQSFLQKAESLRKIRGKISFRRRYTQCGRSDLNHQERRDFCVCG
jgi:hypothetical protein